MVDTASRTEGMALAHGRWAVHVLATRTRRGHSAILLPTIDRALENLGWRVTDLDGFGVVVGPGSFTGIRVGIATVAGLARAVGKPVFGYGSLDVRARALTHADATVVPMLDARKGEVYGAAFRDGTPVIEPIAASPEEFAETLASAVPRGRLLACGGGARLYRNLFEERLPGRFELAAGAGDQPGVAGMAIHVVERLLKGEQPTADGLEPIYLRRSQAEKSRA